MMKQPPYSVPTKQGDESERPTANDIVGETEQQQQQQQQQQQHDAFSRYSNDLQRMKAILLLTEDQDLQDDDDDVEALAAINRALSRMGLTNITDLNQDNNERRRGNNSRRIQDGNVRKTRLSWELHPNLLDALDEDNGAHSIADEEVGDESTEQQAPSQEE